MNSVNYTFSRRIPRTGLAAVAAVAALALTACGGAPSTTWYGQPTAVSRDAPTAATISAPADHATDVPASTELTFAANGAKNIGITLTDNANGATVDGQLRSDGSSWVPQQALKYDTSFTVRLTSVDKSGKTATRTSTFTTMPKPDDTVHVESQLGDGEVYGVGEPIVLNFDKPIPEDKRAEVQKRLFVQTEPAQEGEWNWFADDEAHYRPKTFWQVGTKIHLRALFGGVPLGDDEYGDDDLTVDASITDHDLRIAVDDATKSMTVTQDGRVLKTVLVSMGKSTTPTSTGTMVIMTKNAKELFDSTNDGIPPGQPGYYHEVIDDALRLTWGGQYIHSAPWSVSVQGSTDVSHGCVNLSPDDAAWLFSVVHVGDPVTVTNTGAPLDWGDGWTDWNVPWDEYVQDSAIPYAEPGGPDPASIKPSPSPTAH